MTKINQKAAVSFTPKASRGGVVYRPNLSDFVSPDSAQRYALTGLLDALASNDPERIVAKEDEVVTVLTQVADTLDLLSYQAESGRGHMHTGFAVARKRGRCLCRCMRISFGSKRHAKKRGRP